MSPNYRNSDSWVAFYLKYKPSPIPPSSVLIEMSNFPNLLVLLKEEIFIMIRNCVRQER